MLQAMEPSIGGLKSVPTLREWLVFCAMVRPAQENVYKIYLESFNFAGEPNLASWKKKRKALVINVI